MSTVAVIVVTYYSAEVLPGFLDSVSRATSLRPLVLVADNTPEDDGTASLVAPYDDVRMVETGGNVGYGAAVNRAAAQLPPETEWIVVANPDLVLGDGAIDALLAAGRRLDRIGSLGPAIRTAEGELYPSARKLPSLRTGIGHALFLRLWPSNPWSQSYRNETENATVEHPAGWLSGAFLVVPRRVFEQVGGFDEQFFMYFEDVDLGRRIGLAGYLNWFVPEAEVMHYGARSTSRAARRMTIAHHESAYRYLAKRYRGWHLAPLRLVLRIGLWLRGRVAKG